jgi:hypothetical protein
MLDDEGNIRYAANAKNFCIPSSILHSSFLTLHSLDADGSLHEVTKAGNGEERVELTRAGQLSKSMSDLTIKLILSGKINGTDIKHMRKLCTESNLQSIDLAQAQIVTGGVAYYSSYTTSANVMGDYAFYNLSKLVSMRMPLGITKIGSNAFARTGIHLIEIPDKVTTIGEDAFAYCGQLTTVVIGTGAKTLSKGAFYDSKVKDVYVKAATPPSVSSYLFSSNPTIHVYASSLAKYQASGWAEYGTIVGDLDDDFVDGINEVKNEKVKVKNDDGVYDLMGRKVTDLKPGTIYIKNGKKYMIK